MEAARAGGHSPDPSRTSLQRPCGVDVSTLEAGLKTRVCAPPMVQDHFWKNAFLIDFSPIFAPKTAPFRGILGFPLAQTRPNGLKMG